jgi:hypothetical protein
VIRIVIVFLVRILRTDRGRTPHGKLREIIILLLGRGKRDPDAADLRPKNLVVIVDDDPLHLLFLFRLVLLGDRFQQRFRRRGLVYSLTHVGG